MHTHTCDIITATTPRCTCHKRFTFAHARTHTHAHKQNKTHTPTTPRTSLPPPPHLGAHGKRDPHSRDGALQMPRRHRKVLTHSLTLTLTLTSSLPYSSLTNCHCHSDLEKTYFWSHDRLFIHSARQGISAEVSGCARVGVGLHVPSGVDIGVAVLCKVWVLRVK